MAYLLLLQVSTRASVLTIQRYLEVMIMKKATIIFVFAVVFLFNSMGFLNFSQDNLIDKDNISVAYASNTNISGHFAGTSNGTDSGTETKNPISKTSFLILGASLVMMILIKSKASH